MQEDANYVQASLKSNRRMSSRAGETASVGFVVGQFWQGRKNTIWSSVMSMW